MQNLIGKHMDNNKKYETPEAKEALIDGLSLICQRLHEFYDGKKTSIMPISKLLVTLSLPEYKQYNEVSSEEIFMAVEKVLGILKLMQERKNSSLH
tara:strand:- start:36 stop:323 length:288 start_codon:yes stop_codon:yes gene_type:complete